MTQCCRDSDGSLTDKRLDGFRPTENSVSSSENTEPFSGPSLATSLWVISGPSNQYTAWRGRCATPRAHLSDSPAICSDRPQTPGCGRDSCNLLIFHSLETPVRLARGLQLKWHRQPQGDWLVQTSEDAPDRSPCP